MRRAIRCCSTAAAARISIAPRIANGSLKLREVCTERGIVLIFDEVFMGFRLAPGGAQEYFGVRADMVTYGKTLGGGLPVGVLCGRKDLMKRFREDRPADVCFARGTFNSHPYVMGAMHEFLVALESEEMRAKYAGLDDALGPARERPERAAARGGRAAAGREFLDASGRSSTRSRRATTGCCSSISAPKDWRLSWVGTGRLIFRIDLPEDDVRRNREAHRRRSRRDASRRLVVERARNSRIRLSGVACGRKLFGLLAFPVHRVDQLPAHQDKEAPSSTS